jgi:hypothetical protein
MTDSPKNPAERAQWKMHNFIENYGCGPEAFNRMGMLTARRGQAPMYVIQGDAGNAALLHAEIERMRAVVKAPLRDLSVPKTIPLELDYKTMERRLAQSLTGVIDFTGAYAYNLYPKNFDMFDYLNVTARTYKAGPRKPLTRIAYAIRAFCN